VNPIKALYAQYTLAFKIVGALIVAAIVGYIVYRVIQWARQAAQPTDAGSINSDIAANTNASNLTFEPSDYIIIADNLEQAMTHLGSNDSAVLEAWSQAQNADDIRAIITAFGLRTNYLFSVSKYEAGVIKWMQEELSASSLAQVKAIFNRFNVPF